MSGKRTRNLLFTALLFLAVAAGYFYLAHRPQETEEIPVSTSIELADFGPDDLVQMILESEKERLVLEKEDGEWKAAHDRSLELDQYRADNIASSFCNLRADKVVAEDPADLAAYGLEKPAVRATAVLKDGSRRVFYLGDRTPVGTGYYLKVQDQPEIYTIGTWYGRNLSSLLADVRSRSLPAFSPEEAVYFRRVWENRPVVELKKEEDTEEESEFSLGAWRMVQPYRRTLGVRTDKLQELLYSLAGLEIDEFVDDQPGDLRKYGLDRPRGEVLVRDAENTLHLYFGADYDGENVYFQVAGSNRVYGVKRRNLSFMETSPFDLVEKFAYIVFIDYVDKIEIKTPGESYELTMTRLAGEEEDGEETVIYRVNGLEVEEMDFRRVYQQIIGLTVEAENDKILTEKPEITVTFLLNTGAERKVVVDYVPYNRDFYAVFRDGSGDFLISRQQVEEMLTAVEELARGE